MDIKDILFELSSSCAIGTVSDAADKAADMLRNYANVRRIGNLGTVAEIGNKNDYTILLDAHIDEVGFIVTDVSPNGFLTVQKCGGIDLRHLPAKPVTVHSKVKIPAVFTSTPPHLDKGGDLPDDISSYKIDTGIGCEAQNIISVGDYVTYRTTPVSLIGDTVCGKSFDDRAGVTCLIELARRLSRKELPCRLVLLLSDGEELGLRGARTAAFDIDCNEAVSIDVSFGDGPDVPADKSGKLGRGGMVGISPVIDREISRALINTAKDNSIPYQTEVMGGNTSTNADVISLTKSGIRTGLVSIPLRNMHTNVEVLKISDLVSVCDLLEKYILSGGIGK